MRTRLVPVLVGLIALAIYRATLAPGMTWANAGTDGGDLVTAAAVWGVPHPPGYPTYTVLGHIFAGLPSGSVAFRLNLLSAVCAALAAALIAASVSGALRLSRGGSLFAASIAGLTLAVSPMLWGQATLAEVHALNALVVAAICYLAPPWSDPMRSLRAADKAALGLVWGLGLGNSLTCLALAPLVMPALWRGPGRRAGYAALATGLSIYALIPIRAATLPPVNWYDARDLPGFARLVGGELYQGLVLSAPIDLVIRRVPNLPRMGLEQVGWIGAVWIGWEIMSRREWTRYLPVLLSIGLYGVFAVGYHADDSDLYLIPVWVLSAGFLGVGLAAAFDSRRVRLWVVRLLAAGGLIAMLITGWSVHDLSHDRTANEFAEGVLESLPEHAILITHADAHTFTLWYYRLVEQRRSDVSIVDARLADYDWYRPMLAAQDPGLRLPESRRDQDLTEQMAVVNPARQVCELAITSGQFICRMAVEPGD